MKQVILKTLVLLVIVSAQPAQAQVSRALSRALQAGRQAENLAISTQKIATEVERTVLHQSLSAQFLAMHHTPRTTVALPLERNFLPEPSILSFQSLIEEQRQNFKDWQLKRQQTRQFALEQQMATLPQLQLEKSFRASSLNDFLPGHVDATEIPTLPFIEQKGYLYRGLGLHKNGQSIKNILENGLQIQDVGNHSNCLLMSLASSGRSAATISSKKFTNLTQSPQLALSYALRNCQLEHAFPALVVVTGEKEYREVVQVSYNIPAQQISSVIALLHINGKKRWSLVQWENDAFKITPFGN